MPIWVLDFSNSKEGDDLEKAYEVLKTQQEALEYLETIRPTLSPKIYENVKISIHLSFQNGHEITKKSLNDYIFCEKLEAEGKINEAKDKSYELSIENANLYLKNQGII